MRRQELCISCFWKIKGIGRRVIVILPLSLFGCVLLFEFVLFFLIVVKTITCFADIYRYFADIYRYGYTV